MTTTQKRNIIRLLLVKLFMGASILNAQNFIHTPLNFKLPLLNNKIHLYFPPVDTISKNNNVKIFNSSHEALLTISFDSVTFRFKAMELFKFGSENLYQKVKETKDKSCTETKILTKGKQKYLVVSTYKNKDTIVGHLKNYKRLNELLVRLSDNTLLTIEASVMTKKNISTVQLTNLTEKIFKTIEISQNQRPLNQHVEIINIRNSKACFSIPVPANYGLEVFMMQNNDFQTIFFHKYVEYDGTFHIGGPLSIQTNYNPTYRYKELNLKESDSKITELMFLQSKINFLEFDSGHGYKLIEQIIDADQVSPNLKIHVCLLSSDSYQIKELLQAIENITITNLLKSSNDSIKFKPYVHNHNYNAIYNNKAKIAKYGLLNQHGDIIDGLNYIYNSKDSLVKIEIYRDASFLRDSIMTNK